MKYREMKHGEKVSLLGFGCMRFPLLEDGNIDEVEAERMIDTAIKHGVTYIDTAYPYHNGDSEPFVGRVLKKYDRSSYYLATKLPMFKVKTLAEAKEVFEAQRKRLDTEYFDFYLLHAMDKAKWETAKKEGIVEYCEQLQAEGKIKNFGFSFHDSYEVFEEMINARDWDFCQIQYNYIDRNVQAGDQGYELCKAKGVPMIVMEPIKGGNLAILPEDIAGQFKQVHPDQSISSWALRWVGSHDNIRVILSGMSTMQQVQDNLATFDEFQVLSPEEEQVVEAVAATILSRTKNGCTACRYCMPCPFGVDIPGNFKLWNDYGKYANISSVSARYADMKEQKASQCQKCGKCEALCPQAISIRQDLEQADQELRGVLVHQ